MANMSTLKTTGDTGHRDSLPDEVILYIKDILSNIRKKDSPQNVLYSDEKLKRLVQRFTSDHSKLVESISEGAKKISDKELLKPKWSTVAREVTLFILKGLDIFQSPAAAVASVVANVAERFDEIPAIDRECVDLLEEMLELVKFIKRIKDRQLDLDKQMLETISNAVESAVTGAIVCHSIIRWKTTRRLPLTKVILEELGNVKDKICSSDRKLVHEMFFVPFNKGGMEENRPPNQEESPSLKSSGLHAQITRGKVASTKKECIFSDLDGSDVTGEKATSSKQQCISSDLDASDVTGEKVTSPKQQHISSDLDASTVVVISVNLKDCEKCEEKVTKTINKIKGCDEAKVEVDLKKNTITVSGGADPVEIVNTIRNKFDRKAKILNFR